MCPRPLRRLLPGHLTATAQEMGWGALKNGDLLPEPEAQFDVFISTDQNLRYQQQVTDRRVALPILPTNDWPAIRARAPEIAAAVARIRPGDYVELDWSVG